jgi:hypothetical protein
MKSLELMSRCLARPRSARKRDCQPSNGFSLWRSEIEPRPGCANCHRGSSGDKSPLSYKASKRSFVAATSLAKMHVVLPAGSDPPCHDTPECRRLALFVLLPHTLFFAELTACQLPVSSQHPRLPQDWLHEAIQIAHDKRQTEGWEGG